MQLVTFDLEIDYNNIQLPKARFPYGMTKVNNSTRNVGDKTRETYAALATVEDIQAHSHLPLCVHEELGNEVVKVLNQVVWVSSSEATLETFVLYHNETGSIEQCKILDLPRR